MTTKIKQRVLVSTAFTFLFFSVVAFSYAAQTQTNYEYDKLNRLKRASQPGFPCSYTIDPTEQPFNASGGTGNISVTAASGCNWTATSNAPSWITITSGASGSGNGTVGYSVTLNGMSSRTGTVTITGQSPGQTLIFTVNQEGTGIQIIAEIGIFRDGLWFQDLAGNGVWEGCTDPSWGIGPDRCLGPFGVSTDVPVTGNWDGNALLGARVGVFRPNNGMWYLDNGDGAWGGCTQDGGTDLCLGPFGVGSDIPVTGDWVGDGITRIGTFRGGTWFLDNGNGTWDGCGTFPAQDVCAGPFGLPGDIPVTGNWVGSTGNTTKIGTFRQGQWYLDMNDSRQWDEGDMIVQAFGLPTDIPVTGQWTVANPADPNSTKTKIGTFRNGAWFLDFNGNFAWNECDIDLCVNSFGGYPQDKPVTGAWQPGSTCNSIINPTSQLFNASGGTGSVAVTAASGCNWTATSNAPSWITVTAGDSGSGSGTVGYSVSANTGSSRSGSITIAGRTFTVNQSAGDLTSPVRIFGATPLYFSTLQEAYNAAIDGDLIQAKAIVLTGNLNINRNISVTLEGGYTDDYGSNTGGMTSLRGVLQTISGGGTLTIKNFLLTN